MKNTIISIITVLAIFIACTTAYASDTTAEVVSSNETETAVYPAPAPAWNYMCEGDFYAVETYEEDGVTFIDFNDGSWAVINRNRSPVEYVFQPAVMGDFAYSFTEERDKNPEILFYGAMLTYSECMYGNTLDYVPDGDYNNIISFIFTIEEIETYRAHRATLYELENE